MTKKQQVLGIVLRWYDYIIQGKIERLVTVMVGTDFKEIMLTEILLKDDKVIALRSRPEE